MPVPRVPVFGRETSRDGNPAARVLVARALQGDEGVLGALGGEVGAGGTDRGGDPGVARRRLRRNHAQHLPQTVVERIMRAIEDDPSVEIVIDVVDGRVAVPALDLDEPFSLHEFHRYRLVNGLDDIGLTLQHADEIRAFEARRMEAMPWLQ